MLSGLWTNVAAAEFLKPNSGAAALQLHRRFEEFECWNNSLVIRQLWPLTSKHSQKEKKDELSEYYM